MLMKCTLTYTASTDTPTQSQYHKANTTVQRKQKANATGEIKVNSRV